MLEVVNRDLVTHPAGSIGKRMIKSQVLYNYALGCEEEILKEKNNDLVVSK